MNYRIFMTLTMLSILSISCTEELVVPTPEANEEMHAFYYLDGEKISEKLLLSNYEDYQNIIEVKNDPATNQPTTIYNSFTSDEKYIAWGEKQGYDLKTRLEAANHLRKYAEENDIISEYERTNTVSRSYLDYEMEYLKSKNLWNESNERTLGHVYDFCTEIPSIPFLSTIPVMPSGWNNRVSAVLSSSMFSFMYVFNRSFYRQPITTVILVGMVGQCWQNIGILNNRMSSLIMT